METLPRRLVNRMRRLLGAGRDETAPPLPQPEVKNRLDMLQGVTDLANVTVVDIMVHRKNMLMLDADQPASATLQQVLESPFTRLPLWRDDPENIIGVVHVKDLLRELTARDMRIDQLRIADIAQAPWFVPETTTLRDQLAAFRARATPLALVVDEYGALMGLVTLEDILEEIVGPIADEHDVAVRPVRPQRDGSFLVDGTATIRDLNRDFGWALPDDEATTIAGLVLHEARAIPEVGQVFAFHNLRFDIVRRRRNQITVLRLTPLSDSPEAPAP